MWNLTLTFGLVAMLASFAIVALPEHHVRQSAELVHWTGDTRAPGGDGPIDRPPEALGAILMRRNGCLQCHSTDGSPKIGPSLRGIFGSVQTFRDGSSGLADEAYVRESILDPNVRIVDGFAPGMPSFEGRLREREIEAMIAYIKTLSPDHGPPSNSAAPD